MLQCLIDSANRDKMRLDFGHFSPQNLALLRLKPDPIIRLLLRDIDLQLLASRIIFRGKFFYQIFLSKNFRTHKVLKACHLNVWGLTFIEIV